MSNIERSRDASKRRRQKITIITKCAYLEKVQDSFIDISHTSKTLALIQSHFVGHRPIPMLIMEYLPRIFCYECGTTGKVTVTCDQCGRYYCPRCVCRMRCKFKPKNDMCREDRLKGRQSRCVRPSRCVDPSTRGSCARTGAVSSPNCFVSKPICNEELVELNARAQGGKRHAQTRTS